LSLKAETQRTSINSFVDDYLLTWVEAFLIKRKAQGVASGTLGFYQCKLKLFNEYCETQVVSRITQITPTLIRQYLLLLEAAGHNPGSRHAAFRTLRAFLYWYEDEVEPDAWRNPVRKVRAPKVPVEPLEPVSFDVLQKLLNTCEDTFTGIRDKALLLCLLDTGARAKEFLDINLEDLNQARGDILIRQGKGSKPRTDLPLISCTAHNDSPRG